MSAMDDNKKLLEAMDAVNESRDSLLLSFKRVRDDVDRLTSAIEEFVWEALEVAHGAKESE